MSTEVPDIHAFREAVNNIYDQKHKMLIIFLYLTATRISEVITKTDKWDLEHKKTRALGNSITWTLQEFRQGKDVEKAFVIKLSVLKRKAKNKDGTLKEMFKVIAIPTNQKYEPWTLELLKWLQKEKKLSFDYSRSGALGIVKSELWQLDKNIHTHSLRHYRISHLVERYNFDPYEITTYTGWTFQSTFGRMGVGSGQLDTYLHLTWRRYFPKLLIEA